MTGEFDEFCLKLCEMLMECRSYLEFELKNCIDNKNKYAGVRLYLRRKDGKFKDYCLHGGYSVDESKGVFDTALKDLKDTLSSYKEEDEAIKIKGE